jgi:hypothetical protein
MSERHPEETMPVVASDLDVDDLPDELIDGLLAGARTPEEITGPDGLLPRLTKRLLERTMAAELTEHPGYEHGEAPPGGAGNARNGFTEKTIHTGHGSVRIEQPRDRQGSFEPQIIPKHRRRFDGFDDKIIAMYGRGMSVRDIQAHLRELYGVEVGHDLISRVTDAVLDDVREWQPRPLEDVYPILFLDALIVKVRDGRRRPQPRLLRRDRRQRRRRAGRVGALVPAQRGGEILAGAAQRAEAARRQGRLDLLRRRAERLSGGDRSGVPARLGADLHRPPDPPLTPLRARQTPACRR